MHIVKFIICGMYKALSLIPLLLPPRPDKALNKVYWLNHFYMYPLVVLSIFTL